MKPGGRLIYGTCSILREENEAVVEDFLSRAPGVLGAPGDGAAGPELGAKVSRGGFLRLSPHHARHGWLLRRHPGAGQSKLPEPDSHGAPMAMPQAVHYRVSMPRPHSHLFEVEATFPAGPERARRAAARCGRPGSYLVREYARHLQDVTAAGPGGEPLPVQRAGQAHASECAPGARPVTLRYRVYANELTVRTSHLDGIHGYFNGATVFLYTEALRDREHRVTVDGARGLADVHARWSSEGGDFVAPDYDELVDSPFEVGPHQPLSFTAAGVPHEVVIWGEHAAGHGQAGRGPAAHLRDGGAAVRRAAHEALPVPGLPDRQGPRRAGAQGLHRPALPAQRRSNSARGWEDFLTLAAHEYFHLWNVKRIKPRALVPFDYSQESYTPLLWAFEGMTSYYDNLLRAPRGADVRAALPHAPGRDAHRAARHAGPPGADAGGRLADRAGSSTTGRTRTRPTAPSPTTSRARWCARCWTWRSAAPPSDAKGLDDVMRLLWQRYGDELRACRRTASSRPRREVAGKDLKPFFDRAVRSTEELDYSGFSHVGLEVRLPGARVRAATRAARPPARKGGEKPKGWLGIAAQGQRHRGHGAGRLAGDGGRALPRGRGGGAGRLQGGRGGAARAGARTSAPGETVRLTLFRRDRLMEIPVVLGAKPADAVYLARVDKPTEAQKAAFQAWLGSAWDEAVGLSSSA